jgi:hypothetical protein
MGTSSFPGVRRPGHGVDRPPLSSGEGKAILELNLYSLCAFVAGYKVNLTIYKHQKINLLKIRALELLKF